MKAKQHLRLEVNAELEQWLQERQWFIELQRLAAGRAFVQFSLDGQCLDAIARGLTPAQFLDEVLMDRWHQDEDELYSWLDDERDDEWIEEDFVYGGMVYSNAYGSP